MALGCAFLGGAPVAYVVAHDSQSESHAKTVVITVGDLPGTVPGTGDAPGDLRDFQRINRGVVGALESHRTKAIGFVNE